MHVGTIQKGFEGFECIFEPVERDSRDSNANCNHSNKIHSIRMQIRIFRTRFKPIRMQIQTIRMQILTIRKEIQSTRMQIRIISRGFEALEFKFKPFERDSKHLNTNSNHSKGI